MLLNASMDHMAHTYRDIQGGDIDGDEGKKGEIKTWNL
jgi:hypothetical protein